MKKVKWVIGNGAGVSVDLWDGHFNCSYSGPIFRDKRDRRRKPISHGHRQGDPVACSSAAANKLDGAHAAASDTPKMPEITEGGHGRCIFFP